MLNARSSISSPTHNPMLAFLHGLSRFRKQSLRPYRNQRGVTYLAVMFFVALLGISFMAVNQYWSVILKRDRERELVFRGNRIKAAIERYAADFEVQKGTRQHQYPLTLEALTKGPKRYLQVVYTDPTTGEDFALIKREGEIRGVRSTSLDSPMDRDNFREVERYHDIRFEAVPTNGAPKIEGEAKEESEEETTR